MGRYFGMLWETSEHANSFCEEWLFLGLIHRRIRGQDLVMLLCESPVLS